MSGLIESNSVRLHLFKGIEMKYRMKSALFGALAFSLLPIAAQAHDFPKGFFKMTTLFRENANECLESRSAAEGPAFLDWCQRVSGQFWRAIPAGNGYFRLTTMFREDANECLESNRAGNGPSAMKRCQNVSGQLWRITHAGGDYFRLTSKFSEGKNECLEGSRRDAGPIRMNPCSYVSGQLWRFEKL